MIHSNFLLQVHGAWLPPWLMAQYARYAVRAEPQIFITSISILMLSHHWPQIFTAAISILMLSHRYIRHHL
jgi:hypothetical protein